MPALSLHTCSMSRLLGGAVAFCHWWDIMCCDIYWYLNVVDLLRASWRRNGCWIPRKICNSGRLHSHYCRARDRFFLGWAAHYTKQLKNKELKLGLELCCIVEAAGDLLIQITKKIVTFPFFIGVNLISCRQGDGGGVDIRHVIFSNDFAQIFWRVKLDNTSDRIPLNGTWEETVWVPFQVLWIPLWNLTWTNPIEPFIWFRACI